MNTRKLQRKASPSRRKAIQHAGWRRPFQVCAPEAQVTQRSQTRRVCASPIKVWACKRQSDTLVSLL